MFPSLRGDIDWWKCRSRSSPSILQRSKSLGGGIGRYQGNELATMEERESKGCWAKLTGWRKVEGYLYPSQKSSRCSQIHTGVSGQSGRRLRPPPGGEPFPDERSTGRNSGPWDRKLRPGADTPAYWAGNSGPTRG